MTNTRPMRWLVLWLVLSSAAAAGESSDLRFLAGLRERGLFSLAETYCAERLGREDLPDAERADLTIELSRCLAERAVSSPPEAREPLWQRASQVVEDFVGQHPEDPRLPLVRLQQALGHLARGELARQEAQLAAGQAALLEQARSDLRLTIAELGQLAEEVEQQLREQNLLLRVEPDDLTADQLLGLRQNVQYQLARALRNQAQCYAADSADRANSLSQAIRLLGPLAGLDPADPLAWPSRVDRIVGYRLLRDHQAARRHLDALLAQQPPPAVQLRARAERIRLELAAGRVAEALAVLAEGREIDTVVSPELDYAWLEAYLAAGRAAADAGHDDETRAAQARATEMVEWIEQAHGPYWTRRAGMLLAAFVRSGAGGGDVDILVRAAESSFRSGQYADALAGYDRARTLAAEQRDAVRAFELGYVAATIEHQRGRHEEALARYRQLALAMPDHPQAAEAHLLAIYHAAQTARQQAEGSLDRYTALLQEHLQTWPQGPTADRVLRQSGQLAEYRRDWAGAIRAYQAVSPSSAEYLDAARAIERCYLARIAEQEAAGRPSEQIATEAADWFESVLLGPQDRLPERFGPLERFAVLATARFRLNHLASGYGHTQQLLSAALRTATDAPAEWRSAAEVLSVVCLAGQGRRREAGELLAELSAGSPRELLGMLEGLERVAAAARAEVRSEVAQLQLNAVELLGADLSALDPDQRHALERIHAQALADAGRSDEALAAYRVLAGQHPQDGAIQEAYARLLLGRIDAAPTEAARRQAIDAALAKWRELEERSVPESRRWFEAKYSVASLQYELGNRQQAAKIISLLELLYPELGGPEMKRQFEVLLRLCRE